MNIRKMTSCGISETLRAHAREENPLPQGMNEGRKESVLTSLSAA